MTKIKRTAGEWRALVAEQSASGQTQEEWCISNGVNLYTYRDRASRLRKMDSEGTPGKAIFSQANIRKKDKQIRAAVSQDTGWVEVRQSTSQVSYIAKTENNVGSLVIEAGMYKITANVEYPADSIAIILKGLVVPC
jgi:hypothetical protein